MQQIGQIAFTIIGTAIGGPVGGAIGSMIGAALFAPDVEGPKLSTGAPKNLEYGWPIRRVYGRRRVDAWTAWASELIQEKHSDDGGFLGPTTNTYTYSTHRLYLLSEAIPDGALLRVWVNKRLEFSAVVGTSDSDLLNSISTDAWDSITFFDGSADQLPWSFYEAAVGTENANAYRHRCTIGIENLEHGFSETPPIVEFEVCSGSEEIRPIEAFRVDITSAVTTGRPPFGNIGVGLIPAVSSIGWVGQFQGSAFGIYGTFEGARLDILSQFPTFPNDYGTGYDRVPLGLPAVVSESTTVTGGTDIVTTINYVLELGCWSGSANYGLCLLNQPREQYTPQAVLSGRVDPTITFVSNPLEFSAPRFNFVPTDEDESQTSQGRPLYGSSDSPFSAVVWTNRKIKGTDGGDERIFEFADASEYGNRDMTYAVRGGRAYFMHTGIAGTKLYRFGSGGGAYTVATDNLGFYAGSIAANDDEVFVLESGGGTVHRYDAVTLVSTGTIDVTAIDAGNDRLFTDDAGDLWIYCDGAIYRFNTGTAAWVLHRDIGPGTTTGIQSNTVRNSPQWVGGRLYIVTLTELGGFDYRATGYLIGGVVDPQAVDLADVVTAEILRCEPLTAADIDVTALVGHEVLGFDTILSARESIEQLQLAHYFDWTCGAKLKAVMRGGAPVATLTFAELGAGVDQSDPECFNPEYANDQEVAGARALNFYNVFDDHAVGTAYQDRQVTESSELRRTTLQMVLTPERAQGIVDTMVADERIAGMAKATITVTDKRAALECTDVMIVTDEDGTTYRKRIVQDTYSPGVHKFETVLDDVNALQATGVASTTDNSSVTVAGRGTVDLVLLDIPQIREETTPGLYGAFDLANGARAARLLKSTNGVDFSEQLRATDDAIVGVATTILPNHLLGHVWDDRTTLRVKVSGTLTSSTRAAMNADRAVNVLAIGAHGRWEVIRFRTATLVGTDGELSTYDLSGLRRGKYGTEHAMPLHQAGERVVLLRVADLRSIEINGAEIGLTRYWKAVAGGRSASAVTAQSIAPQSVRTKPIAPVRARVARDTSGNAVIRWGRRTRSATRYGGTGGSYLPIGETTEAYQVDVYADANRATVVRTLSATTSQVAYTAAQQTADGLTPGELMFFTVYQISATAGRGYPLEAVA